MLSAQEILFEDNHLLVINKKPGLLSQGDVTGDTTAIDIVKRYIKEKYNKPGEVYIGLPHRLDRPVSGVLIFCKTSKSLSRMTQLFQDKKIEKQYVAITLNRPKEIQGKISNFLTKDPVKNIVQVSEHALKRGGSQLSVTAYELAMFLEGKAVLNLNPLTGRPHQLRAHLSFIGCPIIGDKKYGSTRTLDDNSIALHCRKMSFAHPVTKAPLILKASYPRNTIWDIVRHEWEI